MFIDNLADHVKRLYDQFVVSDSTASDSNCNSKSLVRLDNSRYAQAGCMYNGPAFQGLNMKALNRNPVWMETCQRHLRVLSGLYGSVRPCDQIQEYRLCMGTALTVTDAQGTQHNKLYDFWGDAIANCIIADLTAQLAALPWDQPQPAYLVNCASQEYFKSIQPFLPHSVDVVHTPSSAASANIAVGVTKTKTNASTASTASVDTPSLSHPLTVVECVFLDQGVIKSTFAKRARGLMAKFLSLHYQPGMDLLELLKLFNLEGYKYTSTSRSVTTKANTNSATTISLVFARKTPVKPNNDDTIPAAELLKSELLLPPAKVTTTATAIDSSAAAGGGSVNSQQSKKRKR